MNRPAVVETVAFGTLLVSGTLLRLVLQDLPNFVPIAAIAMFAGFFFRSWVVAAVLPLAIMVISDFWIGGYDWQMMLLVYGMLALPVVARTLLRRGFAHRSIVVSFLCLVGSSLAASCLFYLVTNFGAWLWFDMYDHSLMGLIQCYVAALPFFRNTLSSDLFFACVLFGGYALVRSAGLLGCPGTREPAVQQL